MVGNIANMTTGAYSGFLYSNGVYDPINFPGTDIYATVALDINDRGNVVGYFAETVPEPATWVMMLIGFVGLGFAFRRSRRKAAFA